MRRRRAWWIAGTAGSIALTQCVCWRVLLRTTCRWSWQDGRVLWLNGRSVSLWLRIIWVMFPRGAGRRWDGTLRIGGTRGLGCVIVLLGTIRSGAIICARWRGRIGWRKSLVEVVLG